MFINSEALKNRFVPYDLAVLVVFSLFLFVLKFWGTSVDDISIFLWAEDGNVFLNEANSLGFKSIWHVYAGYIHLYSRAVAYIASLVSISFQPIIMFAGAVFVVIYFLCSVRQLFLLVGANALACYAVVFFVILQPNNGEVFLNLTNSQWWIALGFFIQLSTVFFLGQKLSRLQCFLMFVFLLSGPFSIALVGALIVCFAFRFRPSISLTLWIVISVAFFIQVFFILNSSRTNVAGMSTNLNDWLTAFRRFILFGANSGVTLVAACVFWIVLFSGMVTQKRRAVKAASFYFVAVALVVVCISLWSAKSAPLTIGPVGIGNRYSFIPYSLIVVAAYLSMGGVLPFLLILFSSIIIVGLNFTPIRKESLQFFAFAELSKFQKIVIPIQPFWNVYPGWHVDGSYSISNDKDRPLAIPVLNRFTECHNYSNICATGHGNSIFQLNNADFCPRSQYVGLTVDVSLDSDTEVKLLWKDPKKEGWAKSAGMRRWAPKGEQKIVFAFEKYTPVFDLSLNFGKSENGVALNSADLYCLDK